jgi:hypothetical protein
MEDKTWMSWMFTITSWVFSLLLPIVYVTTKYWNVLESARVEYISPIVIVGIFGVRFIFNQLKRVAHDGFGLSKELARESLFLGPILLALGLVTLIESNIGQITDVVKYVAALNIIAVPFRVVGYRLSKRYINDTGTELLVKKLIK